MSVFYVRSESRGPVATGNRRIPTVDLVIDRGFRPATVEDITPEVYVRVRHAIVMEFGKCSHVSADRILGAVFSS